MRRAVPRDSHARILHASRIEMSRQPSFEIKLVERENNE